MESLVGRRLLGRYLALRPLAKGGMGEVYLARQEGAAGFVRPVVVKRVLREHAQDATVVRLFQREARVMASLRHPNIVAVLDFGEDEGDHVMVLEYVHGFHLGRWQRWLAEREQAFPVDRAVHIAIGILDALDHAHRATGGDGASLGIVHRDVSPGNVLIDVEGTVKLADFGLARMHGDYTELEGPTNTIRGKLAYLPPEMFDGTPADAATDAYAVAVVLDELLRGTHAFRGASPTETMVRVMEQVPERLDRVRPDVSSALAEVVARGLSKNADQRHGSAGAFANALRAVRRATADEAARELSEAASADFRDPRMAAALGVTDLPSLEQAWRAPPGVPTGDQEPSRIAISEASIPTKASGSELPTPATELAPNLPRKSSARSVPRAALVAAVLLVAAGGVSIAWSAGAFGVAPVDDSAVMVVVERDRSPPPPSSRSEPPEPVVTTQPTPAPAPPTIAAHVESPIELAFRARSGAIRHCFEIEPDRDPPALIVHFDVAPSGEVTTARLDPPQEATTPIGACVLNVASTTRFPARASAVSFQVPLGARRVAP